ncbi:Glucose dehydrogenase [FAD, quinone], partial [Armadillidium vulgare]
GAGSAGAVVASRLSENPDFEVLLLEAGDGETGINYTPAFSIFSYQTEQDWNFTTESSSKYCLAMMNNECAYYQGRILGGSSAINGMVYVRGNKRDYDEWAEMGNYGWSFEEVLPYFKKSEDNRNLTFAKDSFSSTQFTIRDGFRCSTNRAFLLPVGKRKNIDIARNSHVTKVFL